MSLIKIITRDADNITLDYKDLIITNWARREQFELNERILILDLDTRTHPDYVHYHAIADRALEIQEGIRPFLRSDGVVIAYLAPRNTLKVYRANGEIATGNDQILRQVGLGVPFGGEWNRYDCTAVVDDESVKRYVDLVDFAESYLEINNPDFDSEEVLIKRGEYGAVCGAVYKNFASSGNGTLITLPRPENLTVRPEVWFKRTLSVALPHVPDDIRHKFQSEKDKNTSREELDDSVKSIIKIFRRFHKFARQLTERFDDRNTVEIDDEYDVQDLVHSLLWLEFDDIRDEEQSPSHGGSSSRFDFLVKDEKIGIEIKYTGTGKGERELKNDIAEDKEHYQSHPDCEKLICFIYDPDQNLENPIGFQNDLSNPKGPLSTSVVVFPK